MPFETFLGELKVKVTGVKQRSKWSYIVLVRAITCTFMHGFQKLFCTIVAHQKKKKYFRCGYLVKKIYLLKPPTSPPPPKKKYIFWF